MILLFLVALVRQVRSRPYKRGTCHFNQFLVSLWEVNICRLHIIYITRIDYTSDACAGFIRVSEDLAVTSCSEALRICAKASSVAAINLKTAYRLQL